MEKRCTKCEKIKPIESFSRRREINGYKAVCKECDNQASRERQRRNPEQARTQQVAREQRYKERHPERRGEIAARYYAAHKGEIYERSYRQRTEQPEINLQAARKWKQTHRAEHKAYKSAYRARKLNAPGHFTAQEWRELVARHDYTCLCCGLSEPQIKLTADHVVPLALGGANDISNIQPLCFACNSSKSSRHSTDYRLK